MSVIWRSCQPVLNRESPLDRDGEQWAYLASRSAFHICRRERGLNARHRSRTIPPSREVFCAGLCALMTSRHLEGEERWAPLFLVGGREFRTSANSFESAFYLGPVLFVMADQMT